MRCRAQNSPDVEACRRNYLGQRETIPLFSEMALLYMYALVILGSRSPNGQTAQAASALLEGVTSAGGRGEQVSLSQGNFGRYRPCDDRGWGTCRSEG